jgi:hypothetical protein
MAEPFMQMRCNAERRRNRCRVAALYDPISARQWQGQRSHQNAIGAIVAPIAWDQW